MAPRLLSWVIVGKDKGMVEIFRVGLTQDCLGNDGRTPVFDPAALRILAEENSLEYEFMPEYAPEIAPEQAAQYDAIVVMKPRVTERSLAGADRRVRRLEFLAVHVHGAGDY